MGPLQRTRRTQPDDSPADSRKGLDRCSASRDADTQKIGDYYFSCMDEAAIDKKGLQPLQPELDRIRAMKNLAISPPKLRVCIGSAST